MLGEDTGAVNMIYSSPSIAGEMGREVEELLQEKLNSVRGKGTWGTLCWKKTFLLMHVLRLNCARGGSLCNITLGQPRHNR